MVFWVFIFYFLFRSNDKKEHLDENHFRHGYGNYFKSAVLKVTWFQLCSTFFLNNYEAHWQRHLGDILQLKILRTLINIQANSFLGKYHEMKMGEDAMEIFSCTKDIRELCWMSHSYSLLMSIEFSFHFGFLWYSSFVINFPAFSTGLSGRPKSFCLDIPRTIIKCDYMNYI